MIQDAPDDILANLICHSAEACQREQLPPDPSIPDFSSLKILHLTFHDGCRRELDAIARVLGASVTAEIFSVHGNVTDMNVGPALSALAWQRHGARWAAYDAIVVSDTAPIARVFLDGGRWAGRALIVWVCNRSVFAAAAGSEK
jgi:hypothetical protein